MRTFVLCLCRDMNNDIERPSYLFVFHPISPLNKTKKHARLSIRSGRQKIAAAPTVPQELFWFDDGKPLQTGYIVVEIFPWKHPSNASLMKKKETTFIVQGYLRLYKPLF